MALRPKWAVPQPGVAAGRSSHIIAPPATSAVNQTVSPPVATASTSSGFTLGPNDIVGTSFELESAVTDIFTGGANAAVGFSTANPRTGTRHIRTALTGAADSNINFPASTRQFTARFSIYLSALPTGNSRIFTIDGPVGVSRLFLPSSGNLVTQIGGTSGTTVATLAPNTLYVIDVSFDGTTATFQWNVRVNGGTTQTQSLGGQTSTDIADLDFWSTWNGTLDFDLDDLHITNSAADYPLSDMSGGSNTIPTVQLVVPPGAATSAASSLVPTVTGGAADQTVSPPVATATASSPVPVPQLQVPPAVTTASASSPVPVPQLRVSPAVTTASASAPLPTVAADSKVLAPAATASASAPVPVPQLKVSPAAATASASAPVPVPQNRIIVPLATASANGPPPVPKLGVAPPVGAASASAFVPVPQLVVVVPTKGTTVFGYSDQALGGIVPADIERLIGRKYNGFRQNADIPANWASTSAHNTQFKNGRLLSYRALQITTGLWTDINAGTYDSQLTAFASSIVGFGNWSPSNPFYVAFQHEATLPANTGLGTGQDFINAYRYVVDFFDAAGYTAVKKDGTANGGPLVMVLVHFERAFTNTLELGGTETPPAGLAHADFDPDGGSSPAPGGTTYYSGIGIDGYNAITSPGHLKYGTTASNLLGGVVAQAAATGKFTFFGEFACEDGTTTTDHTNKADWLDSVRTYIGSLNGTPQQTKALLTTIKSSAENYNPDSSPQALAAYSRLALDSTFYANSATAFGMLPSLPISVPVATAAASALVPVVQANQVVSPPAATASASAPLPVPQLRVSPAAATASASALVPTVTAATTVSPPAGTASASAPVPTVQLRVSPAAATASASALVPTVGTNPVVSPPVATATASAPLPVPQLQVPPGAGTASASALVPTVTTGAANQTVSPPAATASASAPTPSVGVSVPAPAATASASALAPVPQLRVSPSVATANASAPVPVPQLRVSPPAATATASAPAPTLQDRILPAAATASASSPVPSIQLRLAPAAATASASSPTPVPQVRVIVPAATAAASAIAPTISGQVDQIVLPPVATAVASAPVPTVQALSLISPPTAVAIAFAPTPGVVQKQWPQHSDTQWPPDSDIKWPSMTDAQWAEILGLQWPPDTHDQWE